MAELIGDMALGACVLFCILRRASAMMIFELPGKLACNNCKKYTRSKLWLAIESGRVGVRILSHRQKNHQPPESQDHLLNTLKMLACGHRMPS